MLPTGKDSRQSLTFDLGDSLATIRAKGLCYKGAKIGLWKYYDNQGKLVHAVNESTTQLLYWAQLSGQPEASQQLALNHPLLYKGGKEQLQWNIANAIMQVELVKAAKTGVAEFVVPVDSLGRHSLVRLASGAPPTKYEAYLLPLFANVPPDWIPMVEEGKLQPATYRIRITTKEVVQDGNKGVVTTIEPLGD